MADANIRAVITAEDKASSVLSKFGDNTGISFAKMAGAVALGQAALQGIETIAGKLVSTFTSTIDTASQLGLQTLRLERTFGLTAEQGSGLLAVFERFGVDSDNASKSLGIFESKMLLNKDHINTAGDTLKKYGITSVDAVGNLRNMNDVLLDVSDAFKNSIPITERAGVARELFGRAGQSLIPALIQGRDGIKALTDEAKREGVVLSEGNVKSVLANAKAHAKMDEAIKGVKTQIGLALIPMITNVMNKILDWVNANGGIEKIMREKVIPVIKEVKDWIEAFAKNELPHIIQGFKDFIGIVSFFVGVFKGAFDTIHGAADILNGALWGMLGIGKYVIDHVIGFFKDLPKNIKAVLKDAGTWLYDTGKDIINGIIKGIEDSVKGVGNAVSKVGKDIGSGVKSALHDIHIPGFASGVQNFSGGLAVVGERGPELVNLPSGSSVIPNNQIQGSSGGQVNITFNGIFTGTQQDFRQLAVKLHSALQDAKGMGTM